MKNIILATAFLALSVLASKASAQSVSDINPVAPICPAGSTAVLDETSRALVCSEQDGTFVEAGVLESLGRVPCYVRRPAACPGGGAVRRCPWNRRLWACRRLPVTEE